LIFLAFAKTPAFLLLFLLYFLTYIFILERNQINLGNNSKIDYDKIIKIMHCIPPSITAAPNDSQQKHQIQFKTYCLNT
jgi:hypothetical protein